MSENADVKKVIASNIASLRKKAGYTQLQLAEKLNYSDKAVSKWESGASVPDITVLSSIAELLGVSVDRLLSSEDEADGGEAAKKCVSVRQMSHTQHIITLLSVALVWLIATGCFVFMKIAEVGGALWLSFVWALPTSCIVLLVLNSIWGNTRRNYPVISVLLWTLLLGVYLTLLSQNLWLLFFIGIPGETIIVLWAGMRSGK